MEELKPEDVKGIEDCDDVDSVEAENSFPDGSWDGNVAYENVEKEH